MKVADEAGLTRFWGNVKTLVSGCLPKTGGTITGDFGALTIKRTANDYSAIRFVGSSATTLGYLGCNPNKQPLFTPDGSNLYTIYHSGNLTLSTLGAAASSHSHSNYADKTSTSNSINALDIAVGSIGTQLASDEANISGLQSDVYNLKSYFSSGVAKNASKLGNVAASSYALKTDIPSSLPANGGNADTTDGLHVHSGRNNEANKIVRTDGSGYIQAGWINTTSGGFNNRGTVHGVDNVPTALNRIFCSEDDYLRYLSPAMFKRAVGLAERIHFGSQSTPGAYCKIKINSATSWMLYFRVRVYQSYNYYDIDISGYNYGSSYWYSPKATLVSSSVDSIAVTFGYDSAYNLWVSFPTSSYIGVDVVDAVNGYTQVDNIGSLFQISFSSSIPATAQTTVTAYRTLHKGDSAPASDVYAWAKASSKPSYTASEVGAAASSHSHSNYADKTSTSNSINALDIAVGNIGTQLAADEANISGLQSDVYNLKSYFSSGVANNASKLGGVAASSYLQKSGGTITGLLHIGSTSSAHVIYDWTSGQNAPMLVLKDAENYGIRYHEGNTDKMMLSASGNANSANADLCINGAGDGTVTIRGNAIIHAGTIASQSVSYAGSSASAAALLTNNTSQGGASCYDANPGLHFFRYNGDDNSVGGGDGWIMQWSWNPGSVGGQLYLDDNPSNTMAIRGRNTDGTFTAWSKFYHTGNLNPSNFADKSSTSSSLTSLNIAVGNIGTQLASDEANISGLQSDVYNLKTYFSSGVANNASKLGGVSASSYLQKSGGTITNDINRNAGGSWISARDHVVVEQSKVTSSEGSSWNPVVGVKTAAGYWSMGTVGGESFCFSHDTDAHYNAGSNTSTVIYMPLDSGTIALTKNIPSSLPASDVYSWAKASSKPSYTASEVGAATSSHSHSNYADKTSTSSSLTSLNQSVGSLASQLASDESNISGLQSDVYNLKTYFSNGVANNASKLGGVAASSYATQSWVTGKGYTTNTGTVTSVSIKVNGSVKGTITTSGTIDLGTIGGGGGGPAVSTGTAAPASSKSGSVGDIYGAYINSQYRMWLCLGQVYTNTWLWREVQFIN